MAFSSHLFATVILGGIQSYNHVAKARRRCPMSARIGMFFLIVLVVAPLAHAKNKKKQVLPDYVLKAQTVLVVIHPDAGEHLTNPTANRTAQDNVEKALRDWG